MARANERERDRDDDRDDRPRGRGDREERGFRYEKRSRDSVRERANMRGGNFDSFIKPKYKMYKVRDGKNLIRILPPTFENAEHYAIDIFVNYGIGVDNQSYLSLSKMKNEADPIAEARKEAEKDGDKKVIGALKPRQRALMWVIDRNDEDEGPQLWAAPFTVDKDFANIAYDEDTKDVVFVDDPKEGNDIRFYKEGSGLNTEYPAAKMKLLKAAPLHEDRGVAKDWLDFIQANPLPDTLHYYDYDHIAGVFDGHVRTDDDDDKPRGGKGKPSRDDDDDDAAARKPRRRVTADDDDDAEATTPKRSSRDDDDDAPPRRTSRRDDDDDAEEVKKPRRSRDDEDDAPPPKERRRIAAADDDEPPFEADAKPRRRAADDDDAEAEKPRQSIRDRLRGRRDDKDDD